MSSKQGEWCMIGMCGGGLGGEMHEALLGNEPMTLTRCQSLKPWKGGNPSVAKPST